MRTTTQCEPTQVRSTTTTTRVTYFKAYKYEPHKTARYFGSLNQL